MTFESICDLLPHDGLMCLLDEVVKWDMQHITCITNSHRRQRNPLVRDGALSSIHSLEYAAQAMGAHGGLLARMEGRVVHDGFLAAVRQTTLLDMDLATLPDPLLITATQLLTQADGSIYMFEVKSADKVIANGRSTVMISVGSG